MKGWHVRAAAFVVTAGALLLATDASASGTQLLCLNGQSQFITCPAGTAPISPSPLLPPTTGSATRLAHPDTGPAPPTEPSTTPADTRVSRSPGAATSTEGPKPGAGGLHLVLVTLCLFVCVAVSGTFVYWLGPAGSPGPAPRVERRSSR